MSPQQLDTLRNRMASHCAATECCTADIRRKLLAKGCTADEAQKVLDYLVEESFIDEERFAHAFVADKFRFAHWGRIKIRFSLREKGISAEAIDNALAAIDDEEYAATIANFLQSKEASVKASSPYELKQKLARSAVSRGFEPSLVFRLLGEAND